MKKSQSYDRSTSLWDAIVQENKQLLKDKYVMYNVANDVQFQTSATPKTLSAQGNDDDQF